ncbi:hypothetical protein BC830DRAFT_1123070 [Chytriomyces sp. MP71]|nr:hypothetical protein BC830DRAFT_1123070 [Chytriomyces sp. MP71]
MLRALAKQRIPVAGNHRATPLRPLRSVALFAGAASALALTGARVDAESSGSEPDQRKPPFLPLSQLDYWGYMDRPDLFASVSLSKDPVERMLLVLRWFLSKDTKFSGPHAPLTPALPPLPGEFFRWRVHADTALLPLFATASKAPARVADEPAIVHCIAEQLTRTPSIAAFLYTTRAGGGITARGTDHIQPGFNGTLTLAPGAHNHGVYIHLARYAEEYNASHPTAAVAGWITSRGGPYLTVTGETVVECEETGLRCEIRYVEEPFWGAPRFAVEGRVVRLSDSNRPDEMVVATVWGAWNGKMYARTLDERGGTVKEGLLLDLQESQVALKEVPPFDLQARNESRRVWRDVTKCLRVGDFPEALRLKRVVEEDVARRSGWTTGESAFFDFRVPVMSQFKDVKDPLLRKELGKPYLKDGINVEF